MKLVKQFVDQAALTPADLQIAKVLMRMSGENDDRVGLAAALVAQASRAGSVCIDLTTVADTLVTDEQLVESESLPWPDPQSWLTACRDSVMVTTDPTHGQVRPLVMEDSRLWLDRGWQLERRVADDVAQRLSAELFEVDVAHAREVIDGLWPPVDDQVPPFRPRLAAATALVSRFTVVCGGPGTGKTTTVARQLAMFARLSGLDRPLRIALTAPTGKASARLAEAVQTELKLLDVPVGSLAIDQLTIQRLLGGYAPNYRHTADNPLPHDVVIVDESSMISIELMASLLDAVRPASRVVLLGDPNQLAPVEAGAVLADVVAAPVDPVRCERLDAAVRQIVPDDADTSVGNAVVELNRTWRFGGAIADLAAAIVAGDSDQVLAVVDAQQRLAASEREIEFIEGDALTSSDLTGLESLRADVVRNVREVTELAQQGKAAAALDELDSHRLFCAHRRGPYGVQRWARQVQEWVNDNDHSHVWNKWVVGQPLLIVKNDKTQGLFNGDTGVVIASDGRLRAVFERTDNPRQFAPDLLPAVETVYAMTVHKGQGSQYTSVSVILPAPESPLLTRQMLYTAVTRAKKSVRLVGTRESLVAAVHNTVNRASGLPSRLGV